MARSPLLGLPKDVRMETFDEGNFHVFSPARLNSGSVEGIKVRDLDCHMALERYKPWWLRPTFGGRDFALEFETQFLFWRTTDGRCGVAIPLVAGNLRAFFKSKNGKLVLEWTGNTEEFLGGPAALLYTAVGDDPHEVCETAMTDVIQATGYFRPRIAKPEPAFVDYLGWCTWDAFYHDVSAEKLLDGIDSFLERDIPIRYVVLDDGWQTVNPDNKKLLALSPDKAKFPDGLLPVIAEAKMEMGIDFFGVWHTLQGYWNGVDPDGPLGQRYRTLPSADGTRTMIHPDDIGRFFMDFHDRLRRSGVDFVKVDNQSSLEKFVPDPARSVQAMRAYQHALQGSALLHFHGGLIHCMCNSSDVAYHMLGTSLWRNSDDFFPKQPESHQFHIQTNVLNNLWSSAFALPDWDMFQSHHEHGAFHAAARAISGGPVYVSDRPGEQNPDVLRRLCDDHGMLYRCPRPALPAPDCITTNCLVENRILKIVNVCGPHEAHGVIGLFHCRQGDAPVADQWCPGDLPFLNDCDVVAYSFRNGTLARMQEDEIDEPRPITLEPLEFDLVAIAPVWREVVACLGLVDKYNAGGAVQDEEFIEEQDCFQVTLRGSGTAGFFCAAQPREVQVEGQPAAFDYNPITGFLAVPVEASDWGNNEVLVFL